MSKIVKCNQLLKARMLRLHFKLHIHTRQYYVIFLNWQYCMLLSYVFALAGRTNLQSYYCTSRSLLQDTHIDPSTTIINHVQPSSAAFSTDICCFCLRCFCLRWSEVMSMSCLMGQEARSIIWILFQHASSECSRWSQRCSEIVDNLWGNSAVLVLYCPWFYRSIYQILPQVYCIRVPPLKISAPAILTTRGHSLPTIQKHVGSRKWSINIMLLHVMMRYPLWSMMK